MDMAQKKAGAIKRKRAMKKQIWQMIEDGLGDSPTRVFVGLDNYELREYVRGDKDYLYADGEHNQLKHLAEVGYLSGLPALDKVARDANWADPKAPLDARARAYLDINCGHCHNPNGAANTTGLSLIYGTAEDHHLGICKPPTAAGQGTGDHFFDIVPGRPDDSIIPFRLSSTEPGTMMPEIGRSTMHHEGVALIKAWIAALPGTCVVLH